MDNEYMSVVEFAEAIAFRPRSPYGRVPCTKIVQMWCNSGKLDAYRELHLRGRPWRIARAEVEGFVIPKPGRKPTKGA